MADVGLIRKRLRAEIDTARNAARGRRERAATAERAYEQFLVSIAVPAFRQMAGVLRAEGIGAEVQTPEAGVRLVADRQRDQVELQLETALDPPQPMLVSTRTRGSRVVRQERPVKADAPIETIREDDLLERLFEELRPWLE